MITQEFIDKCKRIYPTWLDLHKHLDRKDEVVGRYLCDSSYNGIDFDIILESRSLEELKELAKIGKERQNLYSEWLKM
jgi:hypothetical protein